MDNENTAVVPQAESETPEHSQSFADAYADLIGDISHVRDEDPEPSSAPVVPEKAAVSSEGVEAAVPAGDTPVEAAPTASDAVVDPEPTNATYRVNGEDRTFEGIKVYPDKSGLIPSEQMDVVLHRLSERDHLFETAQERQKAFTALETEHQAATAWKLDDGRVATGREGAQAKDLAYALTRAERDAYDKVLSDPNLAASLLSYNEATGKYEWNTNAQLISKDIENTKIRLENAVRQFYAQRPAAPATQPATPGAMPAPTAAADALIQNTGVKGFGAEDKAYVAELAKVYVHAATREDVAADPANARLGEPYAPPALIRLIHDRAALLARSAKTVESATQASRENQAKLDAARRGKLPVAPATPAKPEAPAKTSQDERWERENGAAANLLRSSMLQQA